ncbi:3-hydroxyisobutyryl-CoA hydrolase [Malassezia vespertilionis]|uniref:3-hydroxyisobutyryl-CoA hydrolase n=1 Tax=Malassezia vespertilionis TaxID=2020962 RepID=A0A2N1JEJ6_9BASI|nr:3-hydroxyisobutyryl-CoA hydrolase [Malassezia vespertilionis]PKI84973.1 hypothetical protein MVES_001241 [Malassezia vespertilionis]WFD05984.1 3-hydroxyisobutyryl-CoA hydrolase [Malassezia vespertilionis]
MATRRFPPALSLPRHFLCGSTAFSSMRDTKAIARTANIAQHMSAAPSRAASSAATSPVTAHMDASVQYLSEGSTRVIQLNRERAINALNQDMINRIRASLEEIKKSPNAATVLLRGVGRGLCAGGDIMDIVLNADKKSKEERQEAVRFFQTEIEADYAIATLADASAELGRPKWYISYMDGISFGGGIGLSIHAPFRVSTERTLASMPETAIGYFPDVGVTSHFARMDGQTGMYLALTGERLNGADTYLLGLATHFVRSNLLEELARRLADMPLDQVTDANVVNACIDEFASDPYASDAENGEELARNSRFLGDRRIALDYAFGRASVEQIFAALGEIAAAKPDADAVKTLATRGLSPIPDMVKQFAAETLETLKTRSPRSLKVTFKAMRMAREMTLEEVMHQCMHIATVLTDLSVGRDFYVGVMHMLQKDPATGKRRTGHAAWNPATLEEVDDALLDALFFKNADSAHKAGLQLSIPKLANVPLSTNARDERKKRTAQLRGLGPLHWEPQHNQFALPSEAECAALAGGFHPAAGSYVQSNSEMILTLMQHKHDKPSLRLKVEDWQRRMDLMRK